MGDAVRWFGVALMLAGATWFAKEREPFIAAQAGVYALVFVLWIFAY